MLLCSAALTKLFRLRDTFWDYLFNASSGDLDTTRARASLQGWHCCCLLVAKLPYLGILSISCDQSLSLSIAPRNWEGPLNFPKSMGR